MAMMKSILIVWSEGCHIRQLMCVRESQSWAPSMVIKGNQRTWPEFSNSRVIKGNQGQSAHLVRVLELKGNQR